MRIRFLYSIIPLAVVVMLASSPVLFAQAGQQKGAATAKAAAPAPRRDLTGVWSFLPGDPALSPFGSLTGVGRGPGDFPPMTAWGQAKYALNKPGYGPRMSPENNDPSLQCDPAGIPRLLFGATFEFATIPARTMMFFGSGAWRPIWTDGRALPSEVEPSWMGTSVGRWMDDYTFVVTSVGFDERTWLGQEGQPHSDEMRLEERWHRVDHDTLILNATIDDPKTYTTPYKTIQITYKLRPSTFELGFSPCVWSEENAFLNRIRKPAVASPKK
jgi:hypothetical protein